MAQSLVEVSKSSDLNDARAVASHALVRIRSEDPGMLPPSVRRTIKEKKT
jgi:hypothetical protein